MVKPKTPLSPKACVGCGEIMYPSKRHYPRTWNAKKYCGTTCRNKNLKSTKPLADRFWEKVDKSAGPDGCWPWLGARDTFGYGRIRTSDGGIDGSNRIAWELINGPIPHDGSHHGICVLHKCDNPGCCNPKHLFLGNMGTNVRDMTQKNRHGMMKLTPEQVVEIRSLKDKMTYREIGDLYGVSHQMVYFIMTRQSWRHI